MAPRAEQCRPAGPWQTRQLDPRHGPSFEPDAVGPLPRSPPPRVHTQCGPLARGGDSPGKGWGASCVSGFPHAGCQSCSSRNSRLVSSPAPSFNTARTRCPRNQIRNRCNPSAVPSSSLTGRRPGSFPFCMNALNRNVRESREGLRSDAHGKN